MAIIHLVQLLPDWIKRSTRRSYPDIIGIWAGSPVDASLFGLALRGVCLAAHVTTRAGALLPHHFTHHLAQSKDRRSKIVDRMIAEAGLFSVALVVARGFESHNFQPQTPRR